MASSIPAETTKLGKKKMITKVYYKKQVGSSVFGKVKIDTKTRWIFQFVKDNERYQKSYRKSYFKTLNAFEKHLISKGWV